MSKKLVERARNARTSFGESLHFGLVAELADCVEKLEAKNDKLEQQLAEFKHGQDAYQQLFNDEKTENIRMRQQVTLLRDAMEAAWQDGYGFCGAEGLSDAQKQFQSVFAATEPKP